MSVTLPSSFETAVRRLNRRNVNALWRVAAALSAEEINAELRGSGEFGFLVPMLNLAKINLFCKAILASSAATYKQEGLTGREFVDVINLLNDSLGGQRSLDPLDGRDVYEILAAIGNSQFRYQGGGVVARAARAYAFYSAIPREQATEVRRRAGRYVDFNSALESRYGLTIADLLEVMRRIAVFVLAAHQEAIRPALDAAALSWKQHEAAGKSRGLAADRANLQSALIKQLVEHATKTQHLMTFDAAQLSNAAFGNPKLTAVTAALAVLSRDTTELRGASRDFPLRPQYLEGSICALERFPLVRLGGVGARARYSVPNVRWLYRAFTDLVDRLLEEAIDDRQAFGETRGAVLEVYLEQLIRERIPQAVVISERKYERPGQGKVLGPDLTVLDSRSTTFAIIEAKATQASDRTLIAPRPETVAGELKKAVRALSPEAAGRKLADLRAHLPEYAREQACIDQATGPDVAIAVIGDGSVFTERLLRRHLVACDHLLASAPYAYGVLQLDDFETAVEIAAAEDAPLQDILLEYANRTKDLQPGNADPSLLEGHTRQWPNAFYRRFAEELFPKVDGE